MRYFLITALPKSGTTWVQRICRAHPEMHCRTEDQFTKIWSKVRSLARDYNALVALRDRQRDRQGIAALDGRDAIALFYAMVRIALDKAPAEAGWSGIKDLTLSAKGFLSMLPESRVVNVIRDPRDVAISAWSHRRRIGEAAAGDPERVSDWFLTDTAGHWRTQLELADAARAQAPDRTHDIRYEDLIDDFETAVAALLGFFDVARDPTLIEALRAQTSFAALAGRRPGTVDETSYFRKGVAGDWRTVLSPDQVALVSGLCGDHLAAHGYDTV